MDEVFMDDFEQVDESITTKMLDEEVEKLQQLKTEYEAAKKISNSAHDLYEEQRKYVVLMLSKAGKNKYEAEGVGTVSVSTKLKVKYPAELTGRLEFLDYVEKKYGEEGLANLVSVNYNTLQSFYNEEFSSAIDEGQGDTFQIPGVSEPESEVTLSFRKSK